VSTPLDLLAMQLACDPFIGEHDFTSFCRRPKPGAGGQPGAPPSSMVRRVLEARWERPTVDAAGEGAGLLWFHIRATAFCHQMVRSIVGYLVDVGQGRHHAGDVLTALRAKDRAAAGNVAPAQGLVLWEVGYP
jgi:tRNA pseudouridine38-40 synthase